jgi:hypothetical protein
MKIATEDKEGRKEGRNEGREEGKERERGKEGGLRLASCEACKWVLKENGFTPDVLFPLPPSLPPPATPIFWATGCTPCASSIHLTSSTPTEATSPSFPPSSPWTLNAPSSGTSLPPSLPPSRPPSLPPFQSCLEMNDFLRIR